MCSIAGDELLCYNRGRSVNPKQSRHSTFTFRENSIAIHVKNFRWSDLEAFFDLSVRVHGPNTWWTAINSDRIRERLGQPNLNPEEDLFLAYEGDRPIGYLQNSLEYPLKRIVMEGGVDPEYLGRGAGAGLVGRSVELAEKTGIKIAHIPTPYGALRTRRLAKKMGFKQVRKYWEMGQSDPSQVPPPLIPSGFRLRSWAEGDEENLMSILNLSFSRHWGFCPNTIEDVRYRAHMSIYRPEGILFIVEGEKPIGFNWTRIEEVGGTKTGFIGMMGSHPEYRGLGLGVAVMRAGVDYLRGAGADEVHLTVDSGNPSAHKIYTGGGFKRRAVTLWYERRL